VVAAEQAVAKWHSVVKSDRSQLQDLRDASFAGGASASDVQRQRQKLRSDRHNLKAARQQLHHAQSG
jgi:outer membrane protein TolC